jgi:hypothetical protein
MQDRCRRANETTDITLHRFKNHFSLRVIELFAISGKVNFFLFYIELFKENNYDIQRMSGAIHPLPNTPSWRGT